MFSKVKKLIEAGKNEGDPKEAALLFAEAKLEARRLKEEAEELEREAIAELNDLYDEMGWDEQKRMVKEPGRGKTYWYGGGTRTNYPTKLFDELWCGESKYQKRMRKFLDRRKVETPLKSSVRVGKS